MNDSVCACRIIGETKAAKRPLKDMNIYLEKPTWKSKGYLFSI